MRISRECTETGRTRTVHIPDHHVKVGIDWRDGGLIMKIAPAPISGLTTQDEVFLLTRVTALDEDDPDEY